MATKNFSLRSETILHSMNSSSKKADHRDYLIKVRSKATRQLFCEQLKKARIKKGVSQADLAIYLGTRQAYISQIEAGKLNISFDTILRMAFWLDCMLYLRDSGENILFKE